MPKLPGVNHEQAVRALKKAGFEVIPIAQPKFTKKSMPDNPLVYYYQRKRLAGFPAKHNGRRSVRPPGTPSPSGANARRPHEP